MKITMTRGATVAVCVIAALAALSAAGDGGYPAPRYPIPPTPPVSVAEALPAARKLVRQTTGRTPLGGVKSGERAVIFASSGAWRPPNLVLLRALAKAFKERGVDVVFVLPSPPAEDRPRAETDAPGRGYLEAVRWIEGLSRPDEAKNWLRRQNPALYETLFGPKARSSGAPSEDDPDSGKRKTQAVPRSIRNHSNFVISDGSRTDFLDQYGKEVHAIFAGRGGRPGSIKSLGPHGGKFLGNFVYDDYRVALTESDFPGDVWRLIEEQTIEPIAWIDKVRYSEPEGSKLSFEVTAQVAEAWFHGSYLPGHLFLFPHGSSTITPNPAYPGTKKWTGPLMPTKASGVMVGTRNHGGVYPRMEVHIEDNRVTNVRGGGLTGEILRTFLKYPPLNELTFPYYDRRGFWFLYEGGLGTNPKAFLRVQPQSSERDHSGVLHWAVGAQVLMDAPGDEGRFDRFYEQQQTPRGHSFHMHHLFPTYEAHIRGTERWITIIDKGRLTALDNPEVRALAASYGDPETVLREEWIGDLPGINAPGDYQRDYAADPWKYQLTLFKAIENGTYPYLTKP